MQEESYSGYRISKIKKTVDILLSEGKKHSQKYIIYLNAYSKFGEGHETIKEYLTTDNSFIPAAQVISKDETLFVAINVDKIFYIKDDLKLTNPDVLNKVNIVLINDIKLKADIINDTPKGYDRVIDFLNTKDKFLRFIADDQYIYINKNAIVRVYED